jgi:hypothetical protein
VAKAKQLTAGLVTIEQRTAAYAEKWNALVKKVTDLDTEVRAIKRRRINGIRVASAAALDARAELKIALEENKVEFEKPRTRTFHGIKVGFRKLIGKITWEDGEQVVKLIKKHFADRVEILVKTTETPVKGALEQLSVVDLKKVGCSVGEDTDEAVITSVDTEITKLVDALLEDATEPEGSEA